MDITLTTIDLMRHGQCDDDAHLRGMTDSTVSESGWQQMLTSVNNWPQKDHWQQVLTSPLQRCSVFAEKLAHQRQLPCTAIPPLAEMHFGDWDGLSLQQLLEQHGDAYEQFWQAPDQHNPPNGEPLRDFHRRTRMALDYILNAYRGQHCLLLTHAGVIRSLLGHCLQTPLTHLNRVQIGYGGFCQIQVFHHPEQQDWMQVTQLQPAPPVSE